MTFVPNINCLYYIFGTGNCSNKNIKRSWFGIGPRECILASPRHHVCTCNFQQQYKKPVNLPPPPPKKSKLQDKY